MKRFLSILLAALLALVCLSAAVAEEQEPVTAIKIGSWEDVDALADWQYAISKPLCLVCDEAELLEAALRVYQGRALYEGPVPEERLEALRKKYGVIY